MHITVNIQDARLRVGRGVFDLATALANAAVAAAWPSTFHKYHAVSIDAAGSAIASVYGSSTAVAVGNLSALRAAILAVPAIADWLATDLDRSRAALADAIKAECSRRIFAVLSESTQKNLTAYAVDLSLKLAAGDALTSIEVSDIGTARAARAWVQAMLAKCRTLVMASGDWKSDATWPPVPEGVAEIAARF